MHSTVAERAPARCEGGNGPFEGFVVLPTEDLRGVGTEHLVSVRDDFLCQSSVAERQSAPP